MTTYLALHNDCGTRITCMPSGVGSSGKMPKSHLSRNAASGTCAHSTRVCLWYVARNRCGAASSCYNSPVACANTRRGSLTKCGDEHAEDSGSDCHDQGVPLAGRLDYLVLRQPAAMREFLADTQANGRSTGHGRPARDRSLFRRRQADGSLGQKREHRQVRPHWPLTTARLSDGPRLAVCGASP